jgi:head-tail adaptor
MDEMARYRKYVQAWLSFRNLDTELSAMEARVVEEAWQDTSPRECAAMIRSKREVTAGRRFQYRRQRSG